MFHYDIKELYVWDSFISGIVRMNGEFSNNDWKSGSTKSFKTGQAVVQCRNQLLEGKVKKDTPGQSCLSQKKQEEAQKKVQHEQVTKRGERMSKR